MQWGIMGTGLRILPQIGLEEENAPRENEAGMGQDDSVTVRVLGKDTIPAWYRVGSGVG